MSIRGGHCMAAAAAGAAAACRANTRKRVAAAVAPVKTRQLVNKNSFSREFVERVH